MSSAAAKFVTSSTSSDLKPKLSSSSSTNKSPSISDLQNCIDDFDEKDTTLTLSISGIFRSSEATPVSSGDDIRTVPKKKTVDEIWGEIVAGSRDKRECKVEPRDENDMMTLEDFLAKAEERDSVKVERLCSNGGGSGGIIGFGSGMLVSERSGVDESGGARGKRRAVFESYDKVAQQRQRRMIKNRESAARSRERKQAYQLELESMAVKLEEENELLVKEKEERNKERLQELMEKIVPVVEKRKPQCALRRVCSAQW